MAKLLRIGEVAALKGCSRKALHRACEQGKLNTEYDPVNNEYTIYEDAVLAAWQPGEAGTRPEDK
ncbi:MAG TPA: hypothetical protein VNT01_10545 [Symbiobacteriaceae bacterium]|nr:hypothetical protein [Symbiobacteriaceae bacterium]